MTYLLQHFRSKPDRQRITGQSSCWSSQDSQQHTPLHCVKGFLFLVTLKRSNNVLLTNLMYEKYRIYRWKVQVFEVANATFVVCKDKEIMPILINMWASVKTEEFRRYCRQWSTVVIYDKKQCATNDEEIQTATPSNFKIYSDADLNFCWHYIIPANTFDFW